MNGLSELLERAAAGEEVGFTSRDVRERVGRRRRVRRAAVVVSSAVLLGGLGLAGVALSRSDDDRGQVEVAGSLDTPATDLVGLWRPIAYSAVVDPPDGARIEFLDDGSFRGYDGCNAFGGDWSVHDGHLAIGGLESEQELCPGQDRAGLQDILADSPTVTGSELQAGAIDLRSGDDWVAFERVDVDSAGPGDCPNRLPNGPSTFDPAAGTYAAHLVSVDPAAASLSFDVVQWLSGDAAIDRYRRDNPDDPVGIPPNDYWLVNDNDQVRTGRFADASIRLPEARVPGHALTTPATADELAVYVSRHHSEVFWITVQDGDIIEICRQYRP